MYKTNPKSAICHVLQFFVDLTGTQEVDVQELYIYNEMDVKPILNEISNTKKDVSLPTHPFEGLISNK